MDFDLDNPESFSGAEPSDIRQFLQSIGFVMNLAKRGVGEVWIDPKRNMDRVRIMQGSPTRSIIVAQNPYLIVSRRGNKSGHIPLKGNKTLY